MADEVPVSEVLCEAMEYLSKLGSNLRTRSENLKEKRINRNKLKNSHAVQKAASKVLLICELSKKSLDNVETGVRRVLSILDTTSGPSSNIGAKPSNDKPTSTRPKEHYFEYESSKLRISKKISIKHYMSVKVLARRMPTSVEHKYPVYLDCKLYRSRKRLLEKKKLHDAEQCNKRKSSIYNSDTELKSIKQGNEISQNTKFDDDSEVSKDNSLSCKQAKKSNKDDDKVGKSKSNMDDDVVQNQLNDMDEQNNITVTENDLENVTPNTKSSMNKNDIEKNNALPEKKKRNDSNDSSHVESYVINSDDDSISSGKKISRKEKKEDHHKDSKKHRKKEEENKQKKYKHIIIPQDSSDDEDKKGKQINSPDEKKKYKHIIPHDSSNNEHKKDEQIKSPDKEKLTNISSDENSDNDKKSPLSELKLKKSKFSKENNSLDQVKSDTAIKEKENVVRQEKDDKDSEDAKPLIRCVNITKLLKPDVLNEDSHGIIVKTGVKNKNKLSMSKNKKEFIRETTDKRKVDKIRSTVENTHKKVNIDEEYWAEKKSEVKSFKSKEFSVNITRLPKLSVNFLYSHDLVRITQNNAVICETEKINKSNSKKSVKDLSEVKSALLNDSESDNETASPVAVATKKVKDCLHNDSDKSVQNNSHSKDKTTEMEDFQFNEPGSDKEVHNKEDTIVTNKNTLLNKENSSNEIKHRLLNDSDSDKNDGLCEGENCEKNIQSIEKNNDLTNIKDALLNDSDSDKNEEQGNKDKNKEDDGHQFTEKEFKEFEKKVTEIIKSSLLNDSDSDKNENKEKDTEMENKDDDDDIHDGNDDYKNKDKQKNDTADGSEVVSISNSNGNDSEKPSPSHDPEALKSALLNDSSNSMSASEEGKNKEKKILGKNHDEESVNAKKTLLNHSSSSDAENERSQGSSDEDSPKKHKRKHHKKLSRRSSSSSSNEDKTRNPKKKLKLDARSLKNNSSNEVKTTNENDGTSDKKTTNRKMVRSKPKPSGSSGQSSDNQDDKDIDGLTNLNNLNKPHRRRDSTSSAATNNTQSTSSNKNKSKSKASTIGEALLLPESSSDSISDNGNNADSDVEELPPVTGLNGGSIDHLAKDDLLNDSESSGSNDKDKNEDTQNDSEEENNVKSKRRKANAISSDSEVGSSRRKDRDVRLSDFEDSEDEGSEPKKTKRKKGSDSDGSGGSSDGGQKKRRRIKQLNDSDDGSGSDSETEGRNKHGRKNIRKVMGKNQLEEATKKAAREEKERIARIAERQKLYNNLEFDESGKPDEVVLEKVVLDFDPETKEPLIQVDRGLVKRLKPHQANGIKFMWDACFESVKRIKKDRGSGCILAHCMGLGKTLQVISLTHTLLTHASLTGVHRVLVVCPLSTVLNWVSEFRMWLKHAVSDYELDVYELSRYKQNSERAFQLQQWLDGGGVCVLGYEMFRNLSADNPKKYKKKMLKSFQQSLVDPGPDMVVCDEGHLLKNEKTSLSQSMNRVKTHRRIVLTGTPLQNNLKEYYCMVQFVKPNLLGKYNEYLNRFVNPITNGQYTDSTEHDIRIMKRRSHVLHKMLDGAVQRRDYGVLAPFLPPKHEYVLFITLSEVQVKLYQHYLDNYSRRPLPGKSSGFLFPDFQSLQRIWTHPLVLKYNSERYEIMQQKKRDREEEDDSEGSLVDFIDDDDSTPDESSSDDSSDDLSDVSDDSRKKSKKKKAAKKGKGKESKASTRRGTRANPVEHDLEDPAAADVVEVKNENPTEWWIKMVVDEELDDLRNSHKLVLLFDILRQCDTIGDKLLVFSQSLYSLDLIEHFLGKVDEATQEGRVDEKLGGHVGSWSPGVDYFRLDGSTSCENRSIWCKNFNREDNPRARLFLISTRAGGLGINLVAANRVVIFDVSWNPSHDVQSIFRVYRFGQKKPCYVYRFLAMGTMEEKIYERQVTKQAISKRVIDEQQIDRHYAENDLAELYTFQPHPGAPRPLPTLPKDRLFAEMLREHDLQIYKYHEHDSLLENKEEETLSEEERKAAWEDFENEKNKPPPAPFPSAWHNGMVLAQQQQQLAVAALSAMLRKDMPNINENQIRDMLPMIYNSNPGLMQKMGEIYKYAQPGMMNPAMMNPVMNPGGGGGMGGASGLQYEPPWQRQHQQQQQMRLQQLMQQQNQMGAKFYAGGLGSRDPVAMALQQQRAREIMLSGGGAGGPAGAGGAGGAGRPRGRPPLQPRAALQEALAPAPDVVDLDSD